MSGLIGNKVRELRLAKRWSAAELSRRSWLNASTISQIENNRFAPYPGQVAKLAKAFGVKESELRA